MASSCWRRSVSARLTICAKRRSTSWPSPPPVGRGPTCVDLPARKLKEMPQVSHLLQQRCMAKIPDTKGQVYSPTEIAGSELKSEGLAGRLRHLRHSLAIGLSQECLAGRDRPCASGPASSPEFVKPQFAPTRRCRIRQGSRPRRGRSQRPASRHIRTHRHGCQSSGSSCSSIPCR